MTRARLRLSTVAMIALLAACVPVNTWQPNGTGIVSGDPILRESTTLHSNARTTAQNTLTGVMGLIIPPDATITSVQTVSMQWAEGGYEIDDATVIHMSFPQSQTEAFGRTTPCQSMSYTDWTTGNLLFTDPWVFDLINEKPANDSFVCMEPVPGQTTGPTRNMVAVISNSDPTHVVIAIYPTPTD